MSRLKEIRITLEADVADAVLDHGPANVIAAGLAALTAPPPSAPRRRRATVDRSESDEAEAGGDAADEPDEPEEAEAEETPT